jgi:hypothetical protein
MITKSVWQAAHEEMTAEDRRRLGDPPTADEVLAYSRGELDAAEETRVRQLLVAYPEMALALAVPFPEDDEPMSTAEVDRHWSEFRRRMPVEQAKVLQFWRASAALAAAIALMLGVLLWRAQAKLEQPRALQQAVLEPDGPTRGGSDGETTVKPTGESILLIIPVGAPVSRDYRVDLVGAQRKLWRSKPLRDESGTFSIVVPSKLLEPGSYQVVLYGIDGGAEEKLATYSLRVPGT